MLRGVCDRRLISHTLSAVPHLHWHAGASVRSTLRAALDLLGQCRPHASRLR